MAKLQFAQRSSTMFEIWVQKADQILNNLEENLSLQVQKLRLAGMSDAEILKTLENAIDNGAETFGELSGAIGGAVDELSSSVSQFASHEGFDDAELYSWELDPEAREHCGDCVSRSEMDSQTFPEWESLGLPGLGSTECGEYCKCTLTPEGKA
jgi:hypothetical protein